VFRDFYIFILGATPQICKTAKYETAKGEELLHFNPLFGQNAGFLKVKHLVQQLPLVIKRVRIFVVDNSLKTGFKLSSISRSIGNITVSDNSDTEGAYRLAI
jgi:hypothetical protein